ncbi:hypothetical protein HYE68_010395 [Fusarium pseudograminearum]|nr:hypothetical protein HYE68_010395 [Fusarium pseudograminearum]
MRLISFLPRSVIVTQPEFGATGYTVTNTTVTAPTKLTLVEAGVIITKTYDTTEFPNIKNGITVWNVVVSTREGASATTKEPSTETTDLSATDPSGNPTTTSEISNTIETSAGISQTRKPTDAPEVSATEAPITSSKGLSDGAVAGVALGCVVAGLTIGLVAAFILFRRRRKSTNSSPGFIALESRHVESKTEPQVNVVSSTHDAELEQFLLDATPDKEIQAELRSLSELIYQHVETYYHGPQVLASSAEVAQCLVHIGYSPELSGLQAEAVAAVCLAPRTSRVGLRHVLSHIIFRRLDFNSGGNLSMLPPAIAAMAQGKSTLENADSPAISLARSRWRSLSALLLHPNPAERTPLPLSMDEASAKAQSLANELNTFLQLFVAQDSASRQEQTNHLQDVILECTRLGYVLLSQPGDWGFIFDSKTTPKDRTRRIVVCPGLERLSHNNGTRYGSPKEVAAAETMSL